MVKQYTLGQTAPQSDWLIGAGLFGPGVRGRAVRSMKAPGTAYDDPAMGRDPQPAHMRHYVTDPEDNGGVQPTSSRAAARASGPRLKAGTAYSVASSETYCVTSYEA